MIQHPVPTLSYLMVVILLLLVSTNFFCEGFSYPAARNKKFCRQPSSALFGKSKKKTLLESQATPTLRSELVDGLTVMEPLDSNREMDLVDPLWKLALAGTLASLIGDITVHPVDCIKTWQQSDEGSGMNIWLSIQYLWHLKPGVGGFYQGLSSYLLGDAAGGALKFGTFELLKQQQQKRRLLAGVSSRSDGDDDDNWWWLVYVFAALACVTSSVVIVPGEFLKQQLQMSHYDSLSEAWNTYVPNNILGLYAGVDGVLLRDIPYTMMELGLYDTLKSLYIKSKSNSKQQPQSDSTTLQEAVLSNWETILVAALVGAIAALGTTPLDTVKTKLMVNDYHEGFGDAFWTTLETQGYRGIFAGAGARVAWIAPFTAIYLPAYDFFKSKLLTMKETDDTANEDSRP